MGKNKNKRQLDDVKNSNSPELPMADAVPAKKKKKKNKALTNLAEPEIAEVAVDPNAVAENKKKKKDQNAKEQLCEVEEKQDVVDREPGEVVVKKKKKKKKQKNIAAEDSVFVAVDSPSESGKDNNKKNEEAVLTNKSQMNNSIKEEKKKKKKKKQNAQNVDNTNRTELVESNFESVGKLVNSEEKGKSNSENEKGVGEKKNKRKHDEGKSKGNNVNGANEGPKKKKKKATTACDEEEEENTTDNSGKENEKQENSPEEVDIGQWSTDAFEDAERQQKFIKLLGGAKQKDKNFSGIQQKLFSIGMSAVDDFKAGGKPAMTWKQQNNYMETMEKEYEKAKRTNFGRGRGFGYKKPFRGGKKSVIDVSKNKSKKFDD